MRNAGSSPSRSRQKAIIALVVVLPCAPATTIVRRCATSSASRSARGRPSTRPANAVETNDVPARRRLRRLGRDLDRDALEMAQVRRVGAIPAGDLGAPGLREQRVPAHAGAADPGEPDAPTGERLRGRRAHPRSLPLRRAWRPRASPRPWPRDGRRRRAAPPPPGRARRVRLGNDHRAAGVDEPARVLLLVLPRRELAGHEHRRQPGGRELPDRAARPREHDVGRAVRDADLVHERLQDVVGPRDASLQLGVVALAAEVDHGRPVLCPRVEREVVEQARAERAAEDEHDARVRREAEPAARLLAFDAAATSPGSAARPRGTSPRPARPAARGRRDPRAARRDGSRDRDARPPR